MAIHSSILVWRTPWTVKPGGLQFMGSQRVRQDWVTNTHRSVGTSLTHSYVCWQKISQNCKQCKDSRGSFHYPSLCSHLLLWRLRGRAKRGNGNLQTNRQELIPFIRFPFFSITIFYWRVIALNVVLVSAVQQSESTPSTHTSPSFCVPPAHPAITPLEHRAELPVLDSSFPLAI